MHIHEFSPAAQQKEHSHTGLTMALFTLGFKSMFRITNGKQDTRVYNVSPRCPADHYCLHHFALVMGTL